MQCSQSIRKTPESSVKGQQRIASISTRLFKMQNIRLHSGSGGTDKASKIVRTMLEAFENVYATAEATQI